MDIYEIKLTETLAMLVYCQSKYVTKIVTDFFEQEPLMKGKKPRTRKTPTPVTEPIRGRQPMYDVPEDTKREDSCSEDEETLMPALLSLLQAGRDAGKE